VVNRRYCDSMVRNNCRVPIDTAISLLEREIGSAVETRGHLAFGHKLQGTLVIKELAIQDPASVAP
jgi:hypothetical protein